MDASIEQASIEHFTAAMATEPAPASGSAAAMAVAMSAALVEKVARRSPGLRGGDAGGDAAGAAARIRRRALELAGADAAAVTQMIAQRGQVPEAIAIPREIGDLAERAGELADAAADGGKPALLADAIAAGELARAAAVTVQAILRSNTGTSA